MPTYCLPPFSLRKSFINGGKGWKTTTTTTKPICKEKFQMHRRGVACRGCHGSFQVLWPTLAASWVHFTILPFLTCPSGDAPQYPFTSMLQSSPSWFLLRVLLFLLICLVFDLASRPKPLPHYVCSEPPTCSIKGQRIKIWISLVPLCSTSLLFWQEIRNRYCLKE